MCVSDTNFKIIEILARGVPILLAHQRKEKQKQQEVVMYSHQCEMCGHGWSSEEKANQCPNCGQWHINFYGSSFLGIKPQRTR